MNVFTLGDVFRYSESLYVYLAQVSDITYAAKIISKDMTSQLIRLSENRSRNPLNHTQDNTAYCVVVLSTEDFRDQGAHYGRPQMPEGVATQFISRLDPSDIESLKSKILEDQSTYEALRKALS